MPVHDRTGGDAVEGGGSGSAAGSAASAASLGPSAESVASASSDTSPAPPPSVPPDDSAAPSPSAPPDDLAAPSPSAPPDDLATPSPSPPPDATSGRAPSASSDPSPYPDPSASRAPSAYPDRSAPPGPSARPGPSGPPSPSDPPDLSDFSPGPRSTSPSRIASAAVDHLATYFTASTDGPAASPDPRATRATLDDLLTDHLRRATPVAGTTYLALHQWPGDQRVREAAILTLTDELTADPVLLASVADALTTLDPAAGSPAPSHTIASPPPPPTDPPLTPPSPRSTLIAALAATLLFAAAGTGITVAAVSARTGGPGHYTFADDPSTNPLDDFTLFDWTTDAHGTVTGTFQAVDPADHTNDFTQPFTGHQEGRTLTFVVTAPGGTPKSTIRGTLTSTTLTFHPTPGTTSQPPATYRKTTKAAFTKAVHDFEARHPTDTAV